MAQDALITEDGDLAVDANGDVPMVEDIDGLAQSCRLALNMWKGHWVLDEAEGLDRDSVLTKGFDKNLATAAIQDCLLEDPRVIDLVECNFDLDKKTRILNVNLKIEASNQLFSLYMDLGELN